ncbi:MAG TPA: immunoglobulin domain-containing protein, partial [Verrucomicrobiae bacterium]|nr:immunoglobulin domain-containing protein [Verrucomicrobiae bacterium]
CNTLIGPGVHSIRVTVTDCNGNTTTKVIPLILIGSESFLNVLTNTGISTLGALLPQDAIDPHYTLGPVPAPPPTGYVAPDAVVITNLWPTLGSTYSEWIAPTTYANVFGCPSGNYTYTNTFMLPAGANPATASISGRWAADNGAVAMYLNNTLTGNTIPVIYGFNHWTPFTISSGFITGQNTIRFVVTNTDNFPTGLRVEYTNAIAACAPCVPPYINWITPSQTLPEFSTATFNVNAGGTPPFSYQWQFNNTPIAGATNSTLQLHSIGFSAGGLYSVIISNPCGVVTGHVRLSVSKPLQWTNAWWNVASLTTPLSATFGPDLVQAGTNIAAPFAIGAGTTEDFGLPNPGGQIVNVMDINPQDGSSIELPPMTAPGTTSVDSYTIIMDIYLPDTSFGTPSTLFQSAACCVSNLSSGGQDGVGLTLDAGNNLHIIGSAAGEAFDAVSSVPLPVDTWTRVALVVNNPQDGGSVSLDSYINGINVGTLPYLCTCCVTHFTGPSLNWNGSSPIILSASADAAAPNAELYVSSIQFHAAALTPQMIAGIGSPDDGPAPANQTLAGPQPVLTAAASSGFVNFTWTGSPYALQETTDLNSGIWEDSNLPFAEILVNGNVQTTATAKPSPQAPAKFYRLVFRP